MWLERFAGSQPGSSGPSTPQPSSRPYSPAPRRTSSNLSPYVTSQRPGHSPRGSSLSLVSNDSSSSLLASARRANGTALRQTSTNDSGPDPLDFLDKLLKSTSNDPKRPGKGGASISEADIELDVDFEGLSLTQVVSSSDDDRAVPLERPRPSVEEYEKERTKFEDLHRSISACDDVLRSVETNLASFRNDLAAVSADIESLQARSTALNQRLDNRRGVEKALGPLVEELSVSPETISKIAEGHIDESWPKILMEVDKRTAAYKKRSAGSRQTKAADDLGPLLEKLTLKAIERIRDFLVAQIKALRSPHINAQIIQQQNFVRYKDLYSFLHKHHSTLAEEISLAYMNTMRWYYLNQFTRYEKALGKVKLHILDKNDVLGLEDTSRKTTILSGSRLGATVPHDAFNLGRRIDLLRTKNQSALSSYLAEEDSAIHYLEVPFRNYNLALMDNATAEYTFLANFFSPALSLSQVSKNFNYIFEPTFELGRTLSKSLVGETFDALGVLLCIRLNQHFAFELQRRKVPATEGYVNATNMLLWPRLQVIMDRHCESVRQLINAMPSKTGGRSINEQGKLSTAPHVVTQRFGQLLQGFLTLSVEAGDEEPVVASLGRLRSEMEAFLTRQSQLFENEKRKRQRFLYNNYSLIATIIGDLEGKLAAEQQDHFEKLKTAYQEAS